jgi:hypothetical protein
MSLRPCQGCGRHVRNTASTCPFCSTTLEAVPERAPLVLPRAGRAAIMAFGAITSAGAVGCHALYGGPPRDDAGPGPDVFANDALFIGIGDAAAYGGPPVDAAIASDDAAMASDDAAMSESDTGGGTNLYGGPPTDAGDQDAGTPAAAYGGPGL